MRVLDSSFCADFLRGREHAKRYRLDHRETNLLLPTIGLYELYHGAVKTGRDPRDIDRALPWVDTIDYTPDHGLESARIRQELDEKGKRLQHPDMMIAGVARSLEVPVVTSDGGFAHVDDLVVENSRELY